jgi:hypothetical protein
MDAVAVDGDAQNRPALAMIDGGHSWFDRAMRLRRLDEN